MNSVNYKISFRPRIVSKLKTKYRTIKTAIPSPSFSKIHKELSRYDPALKDVRLPILWDRAKDFQVFDKDGNCWIDFTSTIAVSNTGHANPEVIRAIKKQASEHLLHSYIYPTRIRAEFLRELIKSTPGFCERAFLFSSGSEAAECALRIIRAYGQTFRKRRMAIISFQGAMHGVTMGAEFLRGKPGALETLGWSDPGIFRLPFPFPWNVGDNSKHDWAGQFKKDMAVLKKRGLDFKNIAGFIIEPFQGWGAVFFPQKYFQALADFARRNDCLLAVDEIQGGLGRSGRMFTYEHYGIKPDLIFLGKGLGGGLPMSAVLGPKRILELPGIGDNTHSTHSGNPLSCAAALANLRFIKKHGLIKESARKGKILLNRLEEIKRKFPNHISHVFGKGLLAAILFKDAKGDLNPVLAAKVCEEALQKGLLLTRTTRSIKITPPLTIPDAALIEGLDVLEESIWEYAIGQKKNWRKFSS